MKIGRCPIFMLNSTKMILFKGLRSWKEGPFLREASNQQVPGILPTRDSFFSRCGFLPGGLDRRGGGDGCFCLYGLDLARLRRLYFAWRKRGRGGHEQRRLDQLRKRHDHGPYSHIPRTLAGRNGRGKLLRWHQLGQRQCWLWKLLRARRRNKLPGTAYGVATGDCQGGGESSHAGKAALWVFAQRGENHLLNL
jgi:hypothetical protein